MVPICDLGSEGVGEVRVDVGFVEWVVFFFVGSDLGEDSVGFFDEIVVDGVGVGGAEVNADGAAEYEDGDEAAEDCDFDAVECLVYLTATWQALGFGGG